MTSFLYKKTSGLRDPTSLRGSRVTEAVPSTVVQIWPRGSQISDKKKTAIGEKRVLILISLDFSYFFRGIEMLFSDIFSEYKNGTFFWT